MHESAQGCTSSLEVQCERGGRQRRALLAGSRPHAGRAARAGSPGREGDAVVALVRALDDVLDPRSVARGDVPPREQLVGRRQRRLVVGMAMPCLKPAQTEDPSACIVGGQHALAEADLPVPRAGSEAGHARRS